MTHRTITIPPVTAALLAHGVTDWSTHGFRGSVEVGDRGIIVAGAKVREPHLERVGEWSVHHAHYTDSGSDELRRLGAVELDGHTLNHDHIRRVHSRAAVAVGTVAEKVPIVGPSTAPPCERFVRRSLSLWITNPNATDTTDISHLLPYSDWSSTTDTGKQRWAVRWEDMRVLDEPVQWFVWGVPPEGGTRWLSVPLHRGWREAYPGLIDACGESSDD